ncbi:unnamed protein product [Peronospora belbahrii]|uniref:Peptidase S59 domain-containing protein n=1 Tax=Peronospora belbahrii TaxID=622444 RepID=A0AAU9LDS1_9STRA|nr:unnamed protein product [Peronospora belbahrii]
MSFGGFGSSSAPTSGGFGSFGSGGTSSGFGSSAAASPFGSGAATGGFGSGTSTFGAGAAKPTFGGFGAATPTTGGGFGAPQTTTTGFGGFGAAANPATTTGFGTTSSFGGGTATGGFGSSNTSAFGASTPFGAKPSTSPSPFGSTGAFGGNTGTTSAFGGGGSRGGGTTGGFGTPTPASGGIFGNTTSSGFGAPAAKSPFGTTSTTTPTGGFGAQTTGTTGFGGFGSQSTTVAAPVGQVQVGTGQPPYQPTREMEPSGTGGTANYISISRMPAYAHKSTEELRYEDYLKRTNPAAAQAAATQNAPAPAATSGGSSAFGGFGAQPTTSSAFGATGGFGTGQPSAFGAPATGGGFGSSAFGSGTSASTTGGFGGFGMQPAAPATNSGMFGNTAARPTTGAFGAPSTSSAFGAAPGATSAFGTSATGGGFGASTGGFGSSFGATPVAQPQNSAFGGFGAATPAASTGFGASGFGKPAASPGFGGFGATTTPAATPGTGGFGFGATQPQANATSSLFGGSGAAAPASTGFSFGASAPTPAASGGFGFNSLGGTGSFGSTTGSAFGAATAPGAFGTTPGQTVQGTTSPFGSSVPAAGSTGGFGFGNAPSTTPGSTTNLFGAAKPAATGLFGSTASGSNTGLFGGGTNTGGSSFFGAPAATNTGTTGFGFGGNGGGFGSNSTGGFGGFGTTATPATQTGGFGTTGSLFGQPQQQTQVTVAQPPNLVAAPDVNPYGTGSYGAGLVEQNVKAALDLQTIKTGSSASSRLITYADDVGLPRGPLDPPLVTRRQSMSSRHAIPVSFIRGSFKGSKSRFSTFSAPARSTGLSSGPRLVVGGDGDATKDEFKFTSSLFRNSVTKRLVIDKAEQSSARGSHGSSHVSVVPISDNDGVDVYKIGNSRSRLLKADDDGKYSVSFCNQTNKKVFSLRLYPTQTVKQARNEVKLLLRESSASTSSSIVDIELVLKGRILHDNSTIEELQLQEGDSVGVVVIENRADDRKHDDQSASLASLTKMPEAQPSDETVPPKRFMTYDEYLASASRDEADLFKNTEANDSSRSSPASSSCPTLKNNDYYTIPPYERLQVMTDQELSEVDKFTVGCHGLGAVEWIGKTDVRNLDLDELVVFEKKEVIVYKDDAKKHELGKGLNKPAIVELLGIFPPRKLASPENYKERVKQRTQDIGATFLDYSIDKGIWRFRVEHFSRYAFEDDEDDDDDDIVMDGPNEAADAQSKELHIDELSQKSRMTRRSMVSRVKVPFSADRSGLYRQSGIFSGDVKSSSDVASFGSHRTPVAVSDVEMKTDLESVTPVANLHVDFNVAEDVVTTKSDQLPTSEVFPVTPYTLKPLGVDNADRWSVRGRSATYQIMLEASHQKHARVVRNYVDGGMFMARSFRCSWGPNGELVNLGKLTSRPENYSDVQSCGRRVCIEFPLRLAADRKQDLYEGLQLHYDLTSQSKSPNDFVDREEFDVPTQYALPVHDALMNCLHRYVTHAESRIQKTPNGSFEKLNLLVWKLIQALWGQEHGAKMGDQPSSAFCPLISRDDPSEVETLDTFQTIELRREAISQWFEDALNDGEATTLFDGTPPTPEGVLRLLCQHRIGEAADMATDCGNLRLATIIAQAASYECAGFRSLMETQMAQWYDNGSLEFMDKTLVLVYSVLSGNVEALSAHKRASMSWIECLALFLWYKRGPASSLKSAMALYKDAVSKHQASPSLSQFAAAGTDKDDVLMELMKLYIEDVASLCKVLSPSGFMTQDLYHLDYELSWHLHSVLRAIGYKLDRQWESHIHQNFICQLEGYGLWEDALYVALNISDAIERENTCRELLFRRADALALNSSIREDLCERLNLPAEWISEALAVRAIVKQEHHEEFAYWISARHYEEAHACLISHIAMRYMFASEKDALMQLLLELEPMSVYIPLWKSCEKVDTIGGGLLLEYLRLEQQKGLEVGHEDQFLQRIMLLSQQLSSAQDASAKDGGKKRGKDVLVAQTCVSSMIVSLATQAVQMRSLLSYTQERELMDASSMSAPLELEPEFLLGLSRLVTGRETSFVESYRTSQLMHLCTTFIDWRA